MMVNGRESSISIPVRYDWNPLAVGDVTAPVVFQFQLGTIGTQKKAYIHHNLQISIPVRYDWNH